MKTQFTVRQVDPRTLKSHPANFRRHPDNQIKALRHSLQEFGYIAAPIVNERTGMTIIDGHARVELAVADGEESLPVNVIDVSPAQERRILRSFDAITSLALVDDQALDALIESIDDAALEQLLGSVAEPESGLLPGADPDALPEGVETRCKAGDLWRLGEHRLLCGDSTKAEDVERLVQSDAVGFIFSDPPYGARSVERSKALQGKGGARLGAAMQGAGVFVASREYPAVLGDDSTAAALDGFHLAQSHFADSLQVWWGAEYYSAFLPPSRGWLVWDKERDNDFGAAELAWTNRAMPIRLFRHAWNGLVKDSERGEQRTHPTQKPVALVEWCFDLFDVSGVVFDPFMGSGITVIAGEQRGLRVRGCELSPEYCDVILARWEQATGKVAERL